MKYKTRNYNEIGDRIAKYRKSILVKSSHGKQKPASQTDLLGILKDKGLASIGRNTLSDLENGVESAFNGMTLKQWDSLCSVFECSLGHLMGEYECHDYDTQYIKSQIGLSESAINILRDFALKNRGMSFSDIISLLLENKNAGYFLSLLSASISYHVEPVGTTDSAMVEVNIDGHRMVVRKNGLVDSVLISHISEELPIIAEMYKDKYPELPSKKFERYAAFHNKLVDLHASEEIDSEEFDRLEKEWLEGGSSNGNH